jgi:hypothetical protein
MAEVEEIDITKDFDELYSGIEQKVTDFQEQLKLPPEVEQLDIKSDFDELYSGIEQKTDFSNLNEEEIKIKDDLYYARFADEAFKGTKIRDNIDDYKYLQNLSNSFIASYVNDEKKEIVISFKGTDFKEILEDLSQFNPFLKDEMRTKLIEKFRTRNLGDNREAMTNPISQILMDLEIFAGQLQPTPLSKIGSYFGGISGVGLDAQLKIIDPLKEKYPDYNIIFTGFSLGGALSRRSYMKNQDENNRAITFNGATGISPMFDETISCMSGDCKIKNYRIKNDLVSRTALAPGNIITLEPRQSIIENNKDSYFPSHTIKHFINRKNFKETSGFEKGDNPVAQFFGGIDTLNSFNKVFGIPNIIKSPEIIMSYLNSIVDFVNDKSFMPTARVGRERIRSRIGRQIARFNRPPPVGRPFSEMETITRMLYDDEL